MLALKCPKADAQKTKSMLMQKRLMDIRYRVASSREFVYFPITVKVRTRHAIVNRKMEPFTDKETKLKDAVRSRLSSPELAKLKTAYDLVGSIAILEIDKTLAKKEKLIAEALLTLNKSIETVLRKEGWHEGEFRTQKMVFLAGIDTRETMHKENNVRLKLDVERVYFSPRLATERKRIAEQVKRGESILVMFSGCAPYVCVLGKTKAARIVGVEINPEGHRYGLENLGLNKLGNVQLYLGDVTEIVPSLGRFDRILMPLPKGAEAFLDIALAAAKDKAIIHFYDFLPESEFDAAVQKIKDACREAGKSCKILKITKCGQQSPRVFRVCIDFEVA